MRYGILFAFLTTFLWAHVLEFKTLQSTFVQTITNEQNTKIVYKGSFYATNEAKALWIYNTPIKKKIYFNKNKVVIIESELEQAIITNLNNTPNLTKILQSAKKISENLFEANYDETTYFIHINEEKIEKIHYKDRLENSIEILLENQIQNTLLDDTLFEAIIPQEYDIITQ